MSDFVIRDSGKREEFAGGMVRDTAEGKIRPDLVRDGPMFLRWVKHLTKGAIKYAARNWMLGTGQVEYDRAMESADRHFLIWFTWRKDGINIEDSDNPTTEPLKEDHAAAVFFNINQVEYLVPKLERQYQTLKLVDVEVGAMSTSEEGGPPDPHADYHGRMSRTK